MEDHNKQNAHVNELADSLTDDKMSLIDFDRLKQYLAETAKTHNELREVRSDLGVLRCDYINRIGGMVKAIAAVNRHPDGWETALTYLENLPSLSAGELVEQYRKTAARFRDAFPTSFGLAPNRKRGNDGFKDLSVYK